MHTHNANSSQMGYERGRDRKLGERRERNSNNTGWVRREEVGGQSEEGKKKTKR